MPSNKLNKASGFSLTETMVTVLVVAILGLMITGLIPVIQKVMGTIIMRTRSEMLLNNTVLALRDHLRYADNVTELEDNVYKFTGTDKWTYVIKADEEDFGWITVTPYIDRDGSGDEALEIDENSMVQNWHILTDKAGAEYLVPTFDSITYDDDVFTITGLRVILKENGEAKATYIGEDKNPKDLIIRTMH